MSQLSDKNIVLHVGLHKTGTSYLQRHVFPHLPQTRFVYPRHYVPEDQNPITEFAYRMFHVNPTLLDTTDEKQKIDAFIEGLSQPNVLISSEDFFGFYFENYLTHRSNSALLKAVFPAAKVVMVTRRQDKWLESAYKQTLHGGFSTSVNRFLNYKNSTFGDYNVGVYQGPNVGVKDLNWAGFVQYYQQLFGAQNVLVLPYELFVENPNLFLEKFYAFSGLPEFYPEQKEQTNRGYSLLSGTVARVVNKLPMTLKRDLKQVVPRSWHPGEIMRKTVDKWFYIRKDFIGATLAAQIMSLHSENNKKLAEVTGLDLQQYGYY